MISSNYSPRITVLHIEDDENTLNELKEELISRNIFVHSVKNLSDALRVLKTNSVDIIISDGMFPSRSGSKESPNFIPLVNKLKKLKNNSIVIAWSNSTSVHEYCKNNNLESYSKMLLTKERFLKKHREYIDVKLLTAKDIAELVEKKLLEKIGWNKLINKYKFESYYSEPATILGITMALDVRTGMFVNTAGVNYGPCLTEIKQGLFNAFIDKSDDLKISQSIYNKIVQENYFPEIYKTITSKAKTLSKFSKSLKKREYVEYSNKKLGKLYLKFCELFMSMRMYSSLPTALEHGSGAWTVLLKNILKSKIEDPKEVNQAFSILTTPEKISYVKQFELEIAHLGIKKCRNENIQKNLKKINEEYAWINYTFEGIPINEEDILNQLNELGKTKEEFEKIIKENSLRLIQLEKEKLQLINKYKLTLKEKEMFDIGKDLVFLKFFRKGVFAESYYNIEFLLEEIAKRIHCSKKQVVNMLPTEVLAALEIGNFPSKLIELRMKDSVLLSYDGMTYALSKEVKLKKQLLEQSCLELKGQTAFPGFVSGRVKIVNNVEDMKKFTAGEILISRSTNPTLVSAMKIAAAFITDIGGLTCHAAIIAREMKKPCIVGTKIATQVLKNGDLVEVDANKGIVKILKRNSK